MRSGTEKFSLATIPPIPAAIGGTAGGAPVDAIPNLALMAAAALAAAATAWARLK